jgi:N-acetylmuramoyl-L-alanine amidase
MPMGVRPPGTGLAALIEWRANRIQDPVERLRFLKQATRRRGTPFAKRFREISGWRVVVSVLLWVSLLVPAYTPSRARGPISPAHILDPNILAASFPVPQVWPVEKTANFDLYSNGLRVENAFATPGKPRAPYPIFRITPSKLDQGAEPPVAWFQHPAGIVFHSTESHQVPFEASELGSLKRIGRNLLDYIRSQQSYHFVVDRFGRVFRVVAETDIANHSGKSVWSDAKGTYVNLNASFLSIAFEAQTDASSQPGAAQMHAARVLTDMLRSKFGIAATNCVTHAQVSVNPSNWRIGYHTDWASGFPFAELGLPNNYDQILPSMLQFGFDYDDAFVAAAGRPWASLTETNRLIGQKARADGLSPATYRQRLQERYRRISLQLRSSEETQDEN